MQALLNYRVHQRYENTISIELCQEVLEHTLQCLITSENQFSYLYDKQLELSLVLTDDYEMRAINKLLRGIDNPTNVLSMAIFDEDDAKLSSLVLLGDIAISVETAHREAKDQDISIKDHIIRLLIHGLLHIFDINHDTPHQASEMLRLENLILSKFTVEVKGITN